MSAVARVRLFLADHQVMVRQALKVLLLAAGFDVVGEASDGREALRHCLTQQPQVAVLEVQLPLLNGIDVTRELVRDCPATRVVLLTSSADPSMVLAGLRAGAAGYVLKTNSAASLQDAIEAVARDETYLSSVVSRAVVQAYLAGASIPADPLSAREREVLQLLAEGKNVKEIGAILGISARTAETHRARLMRKLNIHEIAGLVRYAIAQGLTAVERPLEPSAPGPPAARSPAERRPAFAGAFTRPASEAVALERIVHEH
jgi:DNA-binding NarL/FixJ family response regulator